MFVVEGEREPSEDVFAPQEIEADAEVVRETNFGWEVVGPDVNSKPVGPDLNEGAANASEEPSPTNLEVQSQLFGYARSKDRVVCAGIHIGLASDESSIRFQRKAQHGMPSSTSQLVADDLWQRLANHRIISISSSVGTYQTKGT